MNYFVFIMPSCWKGVFFLLESTNLCQSATNWLLVEPCAQNSSIQGFITKSVSECIIHHDYIDLTITTDYLKYLPNDSKDRQDSESNNCDQILQAGPNCTL